MSRLSPTRPSAPTARPLAVRLSLRALILGCAVLAPAAQAAPALGLRVENVQDDQRIPERHAFCRAALSRHSRAAADVSPGVVWRKGPEGTRSYALVMHDTDVPADFAEANREGKTIPADAPRRPAFYHWLLVDIPTHLTALPRGAESHNAQELLPPGPTEHGTRLANSFGLMDQKAHGGYDGPCPPWNDARLHHYHFTLYALNVPKLAVKPDADGDAVLQALQGHILAQETVTGTYTQNPAVR